MSHPKQQVFSEDDVAGDNSNQEQLGRFWLQKAKQGFARGHPKRKLGANVLVEPWPAAGPPHDFSAYDVLGIRGNSILISTLWYG